MTMDYFKKKEKFNTPYDKRERVKERQNFIIVHTGSVAL